METALTINMLHHHHRLDSVDISDSPSFSSYASNSLAATASRVVVSNSFDFHFGLIDQVVIAPKQPVYLFFGRESISQTEKIGSPLSASKESRVSSSSSSSISSSSSSEEESSSYYCLWTPNNLCSKRNSIGATVSRQFSWRIKDSEIMKRSKSDVSGDHRSNSKAKSKVAAAQKIPAAATGSEGRSSSGYGGRSNREAEKRKKWYLPYRQNLVSLFPSFHGLRAVITFSNF